MAKPKQQTELEWWDAVQRGKYAAHEISMAEAAGQRGIAKEYTKKAEIESRNPYGRSMLLGRKIKRFKLGYEMTRVAIPIIVFLAIIYFIIGPGTAAVMLILKAMPWYLYVLIIFIGILLWRNKYG